MSSTKTTRKATSPTRKSVSESEMLAVAAASSGSIRRTRTKKFAKSDRTEMARYPHPAIHAAWRSDTRASAPVTADPPRARVRRRADSGSRRREGFHRQRVMASSTVSRTLSSQPRPRTGPGGRPASVGGTSPVALLRQHSTHTPSEEVRVSRRHRRQGVLVCERRRRGTAIVISVLGPGVDGLVELPDADVLQLGAAGLHELD